LEERRLSALILLFIGCSKMNTIIWRSWNPYFRFPEPLYKAKDSPPKKKKKEIRKEERKNGFADKATFTPRTSRRMPPPTEDGMKPGRVFLR